jgi:hypothetical protein
MKAAILLSFLSAILYAGGVSVYRTQSSEGPSRTTLLTFAAQGKAFQNWIFEAAKWR